MALSNAVEIFEVSPSATVGEGVPHADRDQPRPGLTGHQRAGNNAGEATGHPVVFNGDHDARGSELRNQRFIIKGLQGGDIEKTKARVFHPELINDGFRCHGEVTRDQHNDVLAIGQGPVVTHPHGLIEQPGNFSAQRPDIDGPWQRVNSIQDGFHVGGISRLDDGHVG